MSFNFDVQVAHSVQEIGQETWDRPGQGRPFASYHWYAFGEKVLLDNLPIYILLSLNGEMVARATFWLRRKEAMPISSGFVRRLVDVMLQRWPLLLCKSPLVDVSGLVLPDPPLRDAALEAIAQVAQLEAQKHRVSFWGCVHLPKHETRYKSWPTAATAVTLADPGMCLSINWPNFEGYLHSLARKRRKHYRQHLKRADEMSLQISVRRTVDDIDTALALIRNVERKHGSPPTPWIASALEHLDMANAAWLQAHIGGRLVGCELMLGDGDVWAVKALGLDYDFQHIYFLLCYADIRYAIEHRARALHWGSGAYDAKRRLGFQPQDNNNAVFVGQGALLRRLGQWAAKKEASSD